MTLLLQIGLLAAMLGILYAALCVWLVLRQPIGSEALQIPFKAIQKGASAFMKTQYGVISFVGVLIFVVLWFTLAFGWLTATGFLIGGIFSGLSGIIGMLISVRANVRTATAAQSGLPKAMKVAYRAGSVTVFLVGGLALSAFCGFYLLLVHQQGASQFDPRPLVGLGFGASELVTEVRHQFREHPDILSGHSSPDYAMAVSMLTIASIKGMVLPGALPIIVPLAVAFVWAPLGPEGSAAMMMGGILIGSIASGLILALFLSTSGAAWDNAKKHIENGHLGGKSSPAHQAAITGDTVGDPCKNTTGLAINPMRKVLNLMALLLVPFLL